MQDKLNQTLATAKIQAHVRIAAATARHSLLSADVHLRTTDQLAEEQVKTAQEALEVARE